MICSPLPSLENTITCEIWSASFHMLLGPRIFVDLKLLLYIATEVDISANIQKLSDIRFGILWLTHCILITWYGSESTFHSLVGQRTEDFPPQRTYNSENDSMWWRHQTIEHNWTAITGISLFMSYIFCDMITRLVDRSHIPHSRIIIVQFSYLRGTMPKSYGQDINEDTVCRQWQGRMCIVMCASHYVHMKDKFC